MPNRYYRMHSTWRLGAPASMVWQTVATQPEHWAEWWPELRDVSDIRMKPGLSGSSFSCTWQSHIGYNLITRVVIEDVAPEKSVRLQVTGDLIGVVNCTLGQQNTLTIVEVDWQVETTKPWMNWLALVLAPLFIASHHAVMWRGKRGLRTYLKNKQVRS